MKDFNMQKVGEQIKKLRTELGLSQKELAEKIGVAQNTVAQYEKGTSKISIEVLFYLALALDTTCDDILCLED
ncbi:MAG: helix-turn-helix domain-containing protein [Clostridia bacterium]|nr:helix-turn-helix domain-containing protein [Clostridia bacterium]